MNPRVNQVCRNYILRWPLWLVAVVYLVVCGIALYFALFPNWHGRASNVFPDVPHPGPMVNFTAGMSLEQVDRDTRALYWNAVSQVSMKTAVSRPFPKTRTLELVGELKSDADLQFLRALPNLEALSLLADLPAGGAMYVGELSRLRHLRLLELPRGPELKQLEGLTQLRILDVLRIPNYASLFDDLGQFTNLETLVLQGPTPTAFQESDWERLRALPRLKRLYLRNTAGIPDRDRTDLDRAQRILPHVKVRPATVNERRTNIWCYVVFASVLVWGVLIVQLQSQFSHSGSCVIPNYALNHLKVAAGLWAITTILHVVILYVGDCSFIASLAGSLVVPGVYWGWSAAMLRSNRPLNQAGALNPFFSAATCFYTFPLLAMISRYFLSDLDWFLEGRQPALAWVIAAGSVAAPLLALQRIPRLHAIYQECLAGLPPLEVSPRAWTTWGKKLVKTPAKPWKAWWRIDQSEQLDAVVAAPGPRNWARLWGAAHSIDVPQLTIRLVVISAMYLAGFGLVCWLGFVDGGSGFQWLPFLVMMGAMWIEVVFLGLVMIWRARRPTLGFELLRPASRKEFVNQLFAAVWRDLRAVLFGQLLAGAVLIGLWGPSNLPRLFIPSLACYWLFRGLSNYVAILLFLAIRRGWLVFAGLSLIWFPAFGADGYWAVSSLRPEGWFPEITMVLCVAGSAVAALVLVWLKGYWQRIELA